MDGLSSPQHCARGRHVDLYKVSVLIHYLYYILFVSRTWLPMLLCVRCMCGCSMDTRTAKNPLRKGSSTKGTCTEARMRVSTRMALVLLGGGCRQYRKGGRGGLRLDCADTR